MLSASFLLLIISKCLSMASWFCALTGDRLNSSQISSGVTLPLSATNLYRFFCRSSRLFFYVWLVRLTQHFS